MLIEQLGEQTYQASLARIDSFHSNIATQWNSQDDWPTPELWDWLHTVNTLDEQALPEMVPKDGIAQFTFDLPMPGVVRLRLTPN